MLRPLAEADVPRIVELGADPEVARWWRGLTHEHVLEKARERTTARSSSRSFVDGEVAGMIQYFEENDEEFRHASIDLFLGAPLPRPRPRYGRRPDDGAPPDPTIAATTA